MSFNAIWGIKWEHTARVYPKVKWIWRLQRQIHVNYLETDQDAITHNKKKVERTSFGWNSSPMLIVCPWYRSWTWWDQFGVTDAAFYHPVLKHLKDKSCPNNTWPLQVIPQIKDVVVTTTAANLMSWEHMITSLNIMETLNEFHKLYKLNKTKEYQFEKWPLYSIETGYIKGIQRTKQNRTVDLIGYSFWRPRKIKPRSQI